MSSHPGEMINHANSQRQAGPITSPSIQCEHFSPAHLLFAEILNHSTADLREGRTHHFAEVALTNLSVSICQTRNIMRSIPDTLC